MLQPELATPICVVARPPGTGSHADDMQSVDPRWIRLEFNSEFVLHIHIVDRWLVCALCVCVCVWRSACYWTVPGGDLWALFPDRVPAVRSMWSHQPALAGSVGAARTNVEGNAHADAAGKARAEQRAVAPALVSTRKAAIARLRRALHSIAGMEVSALHLAEPIVHPGLASTSAGFCSALPLPSPPAGDVAGGEVPIGRPGKWIAGCRSCGAGARFDRLAGVAAAAVLWRGCF